MQGITDTIKNISSTASDKLGEAGDYLKANPTIAAMLAAGGGAGLMGGYLTSQEPENEDESKVSRRLRILRNALLAGGAGAGAVGLGAYGLDKLKNAIPEGMPHPIQEKFESPRSRLAGGVAGGILGASAGGKADMKEKAMQALRSLNAEEAAAVINSTPENIVAFAERAHQAPSTRPQFKAVASDLLNVNNINNPKLREFMKKLVGNTRAGQLGRLGVIGGLALPEIAGGIKDFAIGKD